MTSKFIKTGNPIGKTDLVTAIIKGLAGTMTVEKHSIHGADAAFCSRKANLHMAVFASGREPVEPASTLYFSIGNAIHNDIQNALKSSGLLVANEMKIEFGPIRGYVDDVIVSSETGDLKIIDVKTCGQLPAKIKPGQLEQLLCYALLTGIREASIIYVSRSVANFAGLMIKEIPASINSTSMRQVARVVAESLTFNKYKTIPPKPDYRPTEAGCGWCPFKQNGCWSSRDGVRLLLPEFRYITYPLDPDFEMEISILTEKLLASRFDFYLATINSNPALKKWSERK
jgi:hypothetical protein